MTKVWIVFLLSLLALALPAAVEAHGGGKQQLATEPVGSYYVYVWTSPDPWQVGQAHTTVAVTQLLASQEETPATALEIFVTYAHAGQTERVAAIEQTGAQAGFYEADASVGEAGEWQVIVEVAGRQGGQVGFAEMVQPAASFNWWLIGGGVLVALLAVGYFGTRKTGNRPVQRGASS
jgi:hypothetical protein